MSEMRGEKCLCSYHTYINLENNLLRSINPFLFIFLYEEKSTTSLTFLIEGKSEVFFKHLWVKWLVKKTMSFLLTYQN